jgi:ribonucleotide reductase beta subunit family protein with ferritin-like domain
MTEHLQKQIDELRTMILEMKNPSVQKVQKKKKNEESPPSRESEEIPKKDQTITESILIPSNERFTLFPIKYQDIWQFFKEQQAAFWVAEEIDYNADMDSWNTLSKDEKYFIEHVLAFFAGADGIVLENINSNFSTEVQWAEARAFYAAQSYIEQVHSQTYSLLIETYIKDNENKTKLFKAIETIPCIKKKAEWAMKWMDQKTATFAERLVAFVVVEGVFFSGAFCAIFWLKNRGLMTKALGSSNELIARDEGLHCRFGVALYKHLEGKLSQDKINEIFKEAVEIEKEFITESLPCKLIGMNSTLMTQYIKFIADYWISKLGYKKIYKTKNPFAFMDMNNIDGKTNFFEKRVTEYQKSHAVSGAGDRKFELKDEF